MAVVQPKKSKQVHIIDFEPGMSSDKDLMAEMKKGIENYEGYIIKNAINKDLIQEIKDYLVNIGRNSLPSYYFLDKPCPDHHRINDLDPRSYVKACMHQFMFHPWNQNAFDLFEKMKEIYYIKNILSGFEKNAFMKNLPEDGHIARLSFQFYPAGGGCIKRHADPVGEHQISLPILQLTNKGEDYHQGGGYVIDDEGKEIDVDELADIGSFLFFHAEVIHGVNPVDPNEEKKWLDFKGRWTMLASVIKTVHNTTDTPNALQLED